MSAVISNSLEMDSGELSEYRYRAGRTSRAIYAVGNYYFAVGKTMPKDEMGGPWRKHTDQFWAEKKHTVLWVCNAIGADGKEMS